MATTWTEREIEYLKDSVGFYKVTTISMNLGRSLEAVELKMKRLGIYNTKQQTGSVTIGELAGLIGVGRNTVKGWVERHGLPAKRCVTKSKKNFHLVSPEEFWDWAALHKDKVKFSDIEVNSLVPEPEWVETERRREFEFSIPKKRIYQAWTTLADLELIKLRNEGLTYKEIGKQMDRSAVSVERRYKRIK